MAYTITLADGSVLENLERNGNTFESAYMVDETIFEGKLGHIVVNDGENDQEFENVVIVRLWNNDDENPTVWFFVLRELTQDEINQIQNRADIEYIAMMADIDLI